MARTARQRRPEPPRFMDLVGSAAGAAGARVTENPALAGGAAVFAVIMFYVATNALYYQPYRHVDAFFSTRSMEGYAAPVLPQRPLAKAVTKQNTETFAISRSDNPVSARRLSDPTLMDVQAALANMNYYSGAIDGVSGPKTRAAIQRFQQEAGLEPTGEIDPLLIDAIRTASIPAARVPAPAPRAKPKPVVQAVPEAAPAAKTSAVASAPQEPGVADENADMIKRIQAGLKAFGNEGISVDGRLGAKTKDAILEFQTLFQLAATGEPNREVFEKLKEIGLISG